ncbi:hypothetical protein [Streptomyces sp. NPDC058252]|uniref:hypothetical protein n=1 Tax=Streptomyces sp. NPDC058252 TaxID=3346405 RepID=UPI0036F10667
MDQEKLSKRETKARDVERRLGKALEDLQGLREANRTLTATNLILAQDLVRAIGLLAADVRNLGQSVAALSSLAQVVQRHEDEIRSGKADATSRRDDIQDERQREAVDLWMRFDVFYDQHVRGLVNRLTRDLGSLPLEERSRRKASMVRRILIELFPHAEGSAGSPEDELASLLEALGDDAERALAELTATGVEINTAAAALGVDYLWAIDEEWIAEHPDGAEGWTGCRLGDPIKFVVRPAFAVASKIIGTATLFTTPRSQQA